jgi:hypothetical protein
MRSRIPIEWFSGLSAREVERPHSYSCKSRAAIKGSDGAIWRRAGLELLTGYPATPLKRLALAVTRAAVMTADNTSTGHAFVVLLSKNGH